MQAVFHVPHTTSNQVFFLAFAFKIYINYLCINTARKLCCDLPVHWVPITAI